MACFLLKSDNNMSTKAKDIIGRAERIDFPRGEVFGVPAKVDTGAWRTSVWATGVHVKDDVLYFTLLGPSSKFYSGKQMSTKHFKKVTVENSFGHSEERYSILLTIRLLGRRIRTTVTLSDRATKTYPILIGRKMLKNKFIVDVAKGSPVPDEELET